ncbi:MAG: NmrA/HSCARG family protein [Flavobacteriaceae bacterium]|nr:NmrA/HSCARG family protein [Flavobacteriaceae bacterium]
MESSTIFISGITGNQGGALARQLLNQNKSIYGLTRDPDSNKAKVWKTKGVEIIKGDMNEPHTYQSCLDKADVVFLVQSLQGKEQEIQQGKRFIDSIKPENKTHLIYSSVLGADLNTGVPHFDSKYELENYIKSKALDYTIIRPASFYENHLYPRVAGDIKKGKYVSPLKRNCKQQMIGIEDIGKITSAIVSEKEKYNKKVISIATDEWLIGDIPDAFSKVMGKPVKYKKLPGIIARLAMGKNLSKMFKYMNQNDFTVINDIQGIRDEFNIEGDFKSWIAEYFGKNQ